MVLIIGLDYDPLVNFIRILQICSLITYDCRFEFLLFLATAISWEKGGGGNKLYHPDPVTSPTRVRVATPASREIADFGRSERNKITM